jgi:hypothetical protein
VGWAQRARAKLRAERVQVEAVGCAQHVAR